MTSTDEAEVSSMTSALDDLRSRAADIAQRYHAVERDDVATELFEVERLLRSAERRLTQAAKALRNP